MLTLKDLQYLHTLVLFARLHDKNKNRKYHDELSNKLIKMYEQREKTEQENAEDYAPTEPLIKDEKIRKVVREWAKVNDVMKLKYYHDENSLDDIYRNTITFNMGLGLKDGEEYTIAELCGEEEE